MIVQYILLMLLVPVAVFTLAYVIARLTGKVTFLDAAWGVGFALIAWIGYFAYSPRELPNLLLALAVSLWGLRLAWYVVGRIAKTGEDKRYQEILKGYGENAQAKAFLRLFMLQAVLQYIVSAAILRMNTIDPKPVGAAAWVGLFIFAVGFVLEVVADAQLAAFKRDPNNKGKILQSGLWKVSRHPNYFGESLVWLGMAVMSLTYLWGWLALISPAVITYLLLFVSGIPIQEKGKDQNLAWREYATKTPRFVPFIGSKKC
jgi:steroid 5-alpha reductase family enzyme